jgi:hypothetical protein
LNKDFFDRASPDFAARRAEARKMLDSLDPVMQSGATSADPSRRAWFEAVYALANGDPARVPWANLAPHRNRCLCPTPCDFSFVQRRRLVRSLARRRLAA